jgi:hypothetical protein
MVPGDPHGEHGGLVGELEIQLDLAEPGLGCV